MAGAWLRRWPRVALIALAALIGAVALAVPTPAEEREEAG